VLIFLFLTGVKAQPKPTTKRKSGIVDQRCSACEIAHGTFKELEEAYLEKTKDLDEKQTLAEFIKKIASAATLTKPSKNYDPRKFIFVEVGIRTPACSGG
jgi:hypothetical protein